MQPLEVVSRLLWQLPEIKMYDLTEIESTILRIKQQFFERSWSPSNSFKDSMNDRFIDLSYKLDRMRPSYLAPAYHFNNYLTLIDKDSQSNNSIDMLSYQIEAQSTFISLKTSLDRLVEVFRYFYKGISPHTTFGRYRENGKARGFMQIVDKEKESDTLLSKIEKEYWEWIKEAVEPRDLISHYQDLGLVYVIEVDPENPLTSGMNFKPVHITKERKQGLLDGPPIDEAGVSHTELQYLVDRWYSFFDMTMDELMKRNPLQKN